MNPKRRPIDYLVSAIYPAIPRALESAARRDSSLRSIAAFREACSARAKIQKWGNDLALRLPKEFAAEVGFAQDGEVGLAFSDGRLVVSPTPRRRDLLGELMSGVTPENLHGEIDTGTNVGAEALIGAGDSYPVASG